MSRDIDVGESSVETRRVRADRRGPGVARGMTNTGHHQHGSSKWIAWYPDHTPREQDPHYAIFRAARAQLIASGSGCWRCGGHDHLEAHHDIVEYAQLNGIDVGRISADFPEITDIEGLLKWAEGPGNLEILCRDCHRGQLGIHSVPYPLWAAERWARDNVDFLLTKEQHDAEG